MEAISQIAKKNGLAIVEDAAQALGASQGNNKAGSFGIAGCFSFYPAKILGTYGDGGAVTTNSKELADKLKLLRNHGRTEDGDIAFWSFNCRLDNLHAAILDLKLKYHDEAILRRREIAAIYDSILKDVPELKLPPPPLNGTFYDAFQNYEIEVEDRDGLVKHLTNRGIETMITWGGKAVHQFEALGLGKFKGSLPRTEKLFNGILMIPMHCELSNDQIRYVATSIKEFYDNH